MGPLRLVPTISNRLKVEVKIGFSLGVRFRVRVSWVRELGNAYESVCLCV